MLPIILSIHRKIPIYCFEILSWVIDFNRYFFYFTCAISVMKFRKYHIILLHKFKIILSIMVNTQFCKVYVHIEKYLWLQRSMEMGADILGNYAMLLMYICVHPSLFLSIRPPFLDLSLSHLDRLTQFSLLTSVTA